MAKQLINPVERHFEKALLCAAGLVLIGVIALFLVTSPNRIELGGGPARAGTIDQKVAQKAAEVREQIRQVPTNNVETPEPLYERFREALEPKFTLALPAVVSIGPDVPLIDPAEGSHGGVELFEVASTSKPAATYGRATFLLPARHKSANWVTVSVVFNAKEQMAEQRRKAGARRKGVVFGPAQLQRRAQRDNGAWSEDDWTDIKPWPAAPPPPVPTISLVQEEGRIVVPGNDLANLAHFDERLRDTLTQLDLIRPLMAEMVQGQGDEWTFPIITSLRDVLMQDDELMYPNDPPAPNPENRYKTEEVRRDTAKTEKTIEERFKEAEQLMESAKKNEAPSEALKAYNIYFVIERDGNASAGDKARAVRGQQEAEQLRKDLVRKLRRGGRVRPATPAGGADKPKRQPLPIQQIWAHDAFPGNVESGKIYQYRIRPLVYNRFAGEPDRFKDPADAQIVFIPGAWSEPVEVAIPADTEFYITSKDERNDEVGVEFYQWFEGVWVKSKRFKYTVGDPVQGESRCKVPSPGVPGATDNALVDFAADATVVDIDFRRPFRERKKGTTRSGVRFSAASTACSVVLVDSAGRLHERFVATDKSHPDKRTAQAREWRKKK